MHAYIWNDTTKTNEVAWPGLEMQHVEGSVYKIEVTSNMKRFYDHDYIIFNDAAYDGDRNTNQTVDISLITLENNNQIFRPSVTYNSTKNTRVFFKTPGGWGTVYAYAWHTEGDNTIKNAGWPGIEITKNKFSSDGYWYIVDNKYTQIIFNNGGTQTVDIQMPTQQDMTYVINDSENGKLKGYWSNYYTYGSWNDYVPKNNLSPSHSNN